MINFTQCRIGLAATAFLVAGGAMASGMSSTEFKAAKERITGEYKAQKTSCEQVSGNAKDVCKLRASGQQKVALAELEFLRSGKAPDGNKWSVAQADANHAVAKEMCDDRAGDAKALCVTEAKTIHTKALADAKLDRKVGQARADAAEDKQSADFKLATEKCESLADDAKTSCVNNAKQRFGKS